MLNAPIDAAAKLNPAQQHLGTADGNPDLREHRILRDANKGLARQVLFDALARDLGLPAGLVYIGNSFDIKLEVVSHKYVVLVGFAAVLGKFD